MTAFVRPILAAAAGLCLLTGVAFAAGGGGGGGDTASTKNPNYAQATKLIQAGDFSAAVPLLQKVVAADPKNADAYNYLGYSERKQGHMDAAMAHYMKALSLKPEHRGANEYLGELYLELGQLDKAKERLDVLDRACFFGCEEYRELKEKIQDYQAKASG
jgi:tetratricopeptide (TPR) repeat protein